MAGARFGVLWPDGGHTGGITESYRDACAYARTVPGATVYQVGTDHDPECWPGAAGRRSLLTNATKPEEIST